MLNNIKYHDIAQEQSSKSPGNTVGMIMILHVQSSSLRQHHRAEVLPYPIYHPVHRHHTYKASQFAPRALPKVPPKHQAILPIPRPVS